MVQFRDIPGDGPTGAERFFLPVPPPEGKRFAAGKDNFQVAFHIAPVGRAGGGRACRIQREEAGVQFLRGTG